MALQEGNTVELFQSAEDYINRRVKQYQGWYDSKAVICKSRYFQMRTITVAGGVVIPVLVNLSFPYHTIVSTLVSVAVAATIALESVYHYREQWKNYRSTEQFLGHEQVFFLTGTGPYEKVASEQQRLKLLIDRVEKAIAAENAATLDVMTLAGSQAGGADQGAEQRPSL